ncbi:MBG domain-containing protein [Azotobacter vinelandii]|uniref:MBG domain-containing protein n=1 Tax=Azotobacter vinelandii TaxID=354 RepID=UPI000915D2B8|nr:MBG domain-containing protein [Azotobacter vinelandii]SFX49705.1 filamentous hemagglutinin family N-terminal domain-containing protein [Azotobacter vinelandii]
MNRIFNIVWNRSLGGWTVASEHARQRGRPGGACRALASVVALAPACAFAADLPSGGDVVSGAAGIATTGKEMTVSQSTAKVAIDWQSFDIGTDNKVTFDQPSSSSIALNRVTGSDASKIMGTLQANGRVFIVNPNGVLFGKDAQVEVGGLVASTLDIANEDFEKGNYRFKGDGSNAAVTNRGNITAADGGAVALLGGTVSNRGTIVANRGTVALAAGNAVTLDFVGDGLLSVQVDEATADALVENHQLIKADGGQVIMTARASDALLKTVVNNDGIVEAQTLGEMNGRIVLDGGDEGTVQVAGTLDASATLSSPPAPLPQAGEGSQAADALGITAPHPQEESRIAGLTGSTGNLPSPMHGRGAGGEGNGGSIEVTGRRIALTGATLDASGTTGGGTIKVGGDWQGSGTLAHAKTTTVDAKTTLKADATEQGDGGKVVVWSDEKTTYAGSISAKGGKRGGDGGKAEVSGKAVLAFEGKVDLTAEQGRTGDLLLDPYDLTISDTGDSNVSSFTASGDDSVLDASTLETALSTANVTVSTGTGGTQAGDITVASAVEWSADTVLTLQAAGNIDVDADITATGDSAGLVLSYGSGQGYGLNDGARITLSGDAATLSIGETGSLASYTLIHDVTALQAMSLSGYYALAEDIDASATSAWNGGAGFAPIGTIGGSEFGGTLAGLGHAIDGLTIKRSSNATGLFGATSGTTIRDLTLSNAAIVGMARTGALIGDAYGTTLTNIHITGTVTGYQEVGGIAGWFGDSSLTDSSSTASVTATVNAAGGLAGYGYYGVSISDSYSVGAVSAGDQAGGLIGRASGATTTLSNVYASGAITGSNAGGLIGVANSGTTFATTNAYWDMTTTGQGTSPTGTGIANSNAFTQATYAGFDFTNTWVMIAGQTRPMLRNEYSTVIHTPHALQLMSLAPSGSYRLGTNLSLAATASNSGEIWGAGGFFPIGDNSTPFTGTFNGQSHTIAGLTIDRGATDYVGLFGYTSGATISNVGLAGGSVTGNDDVGTLIGYMQDGSVTNASASATVSANSSGEANAGGLVGANDGGAISSSSASGNVTGAGYQAGGLVGYLLNGGSIAQSYATGNVTGTNTTAGYGYIGGLVGANGFSGDGGTISQSYATGSVTGAAGPIGGLVGHNEGAITNSYSLGAVIGTGSASNVGGLVGVNYNNGTIVTSYAAGYVSGTGPGGLVGWNNNAAGAIVLSYWNTETTGQSSGIGGGNGNAIARTTAQLQGTLPTGFSASIWGAGANLYPYFGWRYPTTPIAVSGLAYSDAGTSALAGAGVTAISDGSAIGYASTGANGYYYVLADADTLASTGALAYLDNGSANGAAFSDVIGTNGVQNLSIYGSGAHLITDAATLTATRTNYIATFGGYGDSDLSFLSNSSLDNLTTVAGYGVYLDASGDYGLNTNLGSSGLLSLASGGTFGVSGDIDLTAAGDLTIGDAVAWNDTSSLTLTTTSSGDIALGDTLTAADGTLTVAAAGTATTADAIDVGTFALTSGTWRQIATSLPSFSATDFRLTTSATFIRATGGTGASGTPYLIADVYGLQGMASTSLLGAHFALANDIDASGTADWNCDGSGNCTGFNPIGDIGTTFTGTFDGNGHIISDLTLNRSDSENYIGLFGYVGSSGSIANVGLEDGSVSGGYYYIGSLAGYNAGTISGSHADVNVSVSGASWYGGGLVGYNAGSISDSHATGDVQAVGVSREYGSQYLGGLVGNNTGSIQYSYATGDVSGEYIVGGLVGSNSGSIEASYATGDVNGITDYYGGNFIGGLAGVNNNGSISDSYASGKVTGNYDVGGLVGDNFAYGGTASIGNSYATGSVTGTNYIGGLVGTNNSSITASFYATTDTDGNAINNGSDGAWTGNAYGTAKTLAQLQTLSTFTDAGWDIDDEGGTGKTWRLYEGDTTPLLRHFLTAVTVTADGSASKTYDGTSTGSLGSGYTATLTDGSAADASPIDGTLTYTTGSANAGSYTLAAGTLGLGGLYSDQQGYDIGYAGTASVSIDKAALTVTANDADKTYDGLAYSGGNGVTYSGFVNGEDTSVLSGTLGYGGTAQGAVNAGDYAIAASGLSATNYAIAYVAGDLSIDRAALTITASDASKTYGETANLSDYSVSGLVNGDSVGRVDLASTGEPATATVGRYAIAASGAEGTGLSNYDIGYVDGTLTVGKAGLTITASDASKTYGETASLGGYSVSGLVNGDSVGRVDLAGAGTANTATVGSYTITASDADGTGLSNYDITYVDGTLTVAKAGLTITANDTSKTYGETASLNGYTVDGLVNGDGVNSVDLASTGKAATATVGSYAIAASGAEGTGLSNYDIGYVDGTLTVGKAGLTITASDASKTYGETASLGGYSVSGLVNGDSVGSVDLASTGEAATAMVGRYTTTASNADGTGLSNYDIGYVDGSLTVGKAGLTITASNASKTYGETASLSGYSVSGLVNGDSVGRVDLASAGKTATATVGSYAITAANADGTGLSNYDIGYVDGTLTIGKAGLTITANDAGKTYDGLAFSGGNGVSYSGFVEGEDASVLSGTLVYGGSAQGAVDAGGYELSAGGLTSGNYAIAYLPGGLTITPAIPVVAEPSRLFQPPAAYADILASVHDNERKPLVLGGQRDPYQVIDTGIRLPEGI